MDWRPTEDRVSWTAKSIKMIFLHAYYPNSCLAISRYFMLRTLTVLSQLRLTDVTMETITILLQGPVICSLMLLLKKSFIFNFFHKMDISLGKIKKLTLAVGPLALQQLIFTYLSL